MDNNEEQTWSTKGVIQICEIFTSKKDNSRKRAKIISERFVQIFKKLKSQRYSKHKSQIALFINKIYLLESILESVTEIHKKFNVGDVKIIRVLILGQEVYELQKFIRQSLWRNDEMDQFIAFMKQLIESRIKILKQQNISETDYANLYFLKKLFFAEDHNIQQLYKFFRNEIPSLQKERNLQKNIKQLCIQLLKHLYREFSYKQILQPLRLQILYLVVIMETKLAIIQNSTTMKSSYIHYANKLEGPSIFEIFFDNVPQITIDKEKAYLKSELMRHQERSRKSIQ